MADNPTTLRGADLYLFETIHQKLEGMMEIRESNPPFSIDVDHGVVTLSGVVPNEKIKRDVLMAAARTEKVKRVVDHLRTDPEIERDVAMIVANEETLRSVPPIIVTSYNGRVTLTGWVDSEEQVLKSTTLAESIAGVITVINHITVR